MKIREYNKSDGSTGQEYSLEAGDKCTLAADDYLTIKAGVGNNMKFDKTVIMAQLDNGQQIEIKLTGAQMTNLKNIKAKTGNLKGQRIICTSYPNKFKKGESCVGINLDGASVSTQPTTLPTTPAATPSFPSFPAPTSTSLPAELQKVVDFCVSNPVAFNQAFRVATNVTPTAFMNWLKSPQSEVRGVYDNGVLMSVYYDIVNRLDGTAIKVN
jgi:hypothetical protein